jgi:microcystin-dependent protein
MSEPFVGEIRMFASNFAPHGWAFCDGQLLAISQNDVLFSLLGTIYGGDGRTTFGLPDLRGRIPIHAGNGPGLSSRQLGAKAGEETVTLTVNQIPNHSHPPAAVSGAGNSVSPEATTWAGAPGSAIYVGGSAPDTDLAPDIAAATGNSQSHTNIQPSLCVNFIISLYGIDPSRH